MSEEITKQVLLERSLRTAVKNDEFVNDKSNALNRIGKSAMISNCSKGLKILSISSLIIIIKIRF